MWKMLFFMIVGLGGLSACGGSGSTAPVVVENPVPQPPLSRDAYARFVTQDDAAILRIAGDIDQGLRGIPGTNWASIPVSGQALFLGIGQGAIGDLTFRGDAVVTVDFTEDDITGGLRNIVAADLQSTYETDAAIVFSNGDVRATRPSDFTVDYAGTLEFGAATYELDGQMTGLLRGTRLGVTQRSPIKALSAEDIGGAALVNGLPANIDLTIVAETR